MKRSGQTRLSLFPPPTQGGMLALSDRAFGSLSGVESDRIRDLGERLTRQLGLTSALHLADADLWGQGFLQSFHRSHPSKRQLGVRVSRGVDTNSIVAACVRLLHDKDGKKKRLGGLLPGGIHVYLSAKFDDQDPLEWRRPMVYVYEELEDDKCYDNFRPDVLLLPRSHNPQSRWSGQGSEDNVLVPRGRRHESVFHLPLVKLEPDRDGLPVPRSIECNAGISRPIGDRESLTGQGNAIGTLFSEVLALIDCVVGQHGRGRPALAQVLGLPAVLECDWTVLPGSQVDAGALARYVADGKDYDDEERALWDYRLDIGRTVNSYFIVCKVPKSVRVALRASALLLSDQAVSEALREIAEVGFAVGETMRSGKAAVGVLGVVGAIRLLQSAWPNNPTHGDAIERGACTVVIPVDCFTDVLVAKPKSGATKRRADLLAVRLAWCQEPTPRLALAACAIECKFTSAVFPEGKVKDALDQAKATSNMFDEIVELAQSGAGMHARLALARLIQFGMRLLAARDQVSLADEQIVLDLVLSGDFELVRPIQKNLLVSTSCGSQGQAAFDYLQEGWWVSLTKDSWPATRDGWSDPVVDLVSRNFDDAERFAQNASDGSMTGGVQTTRATKPTPPTPNKPSTAAKPASAPDVTEAASGADQETVQQGGSDLPPKERDPTSKSAKRESRLHPAFEGFVGNRAATETLSLFLDYAERKGIKQILSIGLSGPRSAGKTELSRRVSSALGVPSMSLSETSLRDVDQLSNRMQACAREAGKPMAPVAREGGHTVLLAPPMLVFIDEVHQLSTRVQDSLLTVLEEKDRVLRGSNETIDARNVSFMIATTDWGKLREPLQTRVRRINLEPYSTDQVAEMLRIQIELASESNESSSGIDPSTKSIGYEALCAIATAARAIPRTAISFLREIGMALATGDLPSTSLESVWVYLQQKVPCDRLGLTRQDRRYLRILSDRRSAGLDNLATELGTDRSNVEKEIEPFLVQMGWVQRRAAGRVLTQPGRQLIMQLGRDNE